MGIRALYTAASGMEAQLRHIDVIANNVANINTTGFKKDRVNFADLFYRHQALAGATGIGPNPRPSGIHIGHGVQVVSTQKIFTTEPSKPTGIDTHVAIQGPANLFFQIQLPDGDVAYTRAGDFTRNPQGELVTPNGNHLFGPIVIPQDATAVDIRPDGRVLAQISPADAPDEVGRITLARFVNPAGLTPAGDNLFYATPAAGPVQLVEPGSPATGYLSKGRLEASGVDAVLELVQLIQGQRAYEINSNVIQTADEALQIANNLRG